MKLPVNVEIALTHIMTRKKQTLIAALGVTIGIALYIFSNSLMRGFSVYSRNEMFKIMPHIKIFKEDEISRPLLANASEKDIILIRNPSITTTSKSVIDPYRLIKEVDKQSFVKNVAPQVSIDFFYNNGKSQLKGIGSGVNISEANAMFNIQSTMLAGDLQALANNLSGIVIGKGVAEKLNLGLDDNVTISSSRGVVKVMKIIGIFSTGNKATDESKAYMHINTAQKLSKESADYVTDIYLNVNNPDSSLFYATRLQTMTNYKVEDWQTSNADSLAGDKIRIVMNTTVALAIMMVAAFGIYNILNMTITQKMNDIAILKATGFSGKDIVRIFVLEALIMGVIGTLLGLTTGAILIEILSRIYIGAPIGYFPIYYNSGVFGVGGLFGMLASLGAGYLPARKAAKIDPVEIFRK